MLSALPDWGLICCGGPSHVLAPIAAIPGASPIYHGDPMWLTLPASRANFMAAEAFAAPVSAAPEYTEMRRRYMAPQPDALDWVRARLEPLLIEPPMEHQWAFMAMACNRRGVLNASQQGTGKTLPMWGLAEAAGASRVLVLAPKSGMRQLAAEKHRFFRSDLLPVTVDEGSLPERGEVIRELARSGERLAAVVNYEALYDLRHVIIEHWRPDFVALDESWRIKEPRTQVARAAHLVCDGARRVLPMSGTPIGNSPSDYWSQLRAFYGAHNIETFDEFEGAYTRMVKQEGARHAKMVPRGARNPGELMRRLEPAYFRATKATCTDLPPKAPPVRVTLRLPPDVRALYDRVHRDGMAAIGDGLDLGGQRVVKLRLQQIVGGHLVDEVDEDGRFRSQELPSPKVEWCEQFARDFLHGDRTVRAIFWCKFNDEVDRLVRALRAVLGDWAVRGFTGSGPHRIDGQALEDAKDDFNSRDPEGLQAIVAQIKKMCFTHNLQAGDHSVQYSHTWSYIERDQLEDRTHRQGRTGSSPRYWDLVAQGTVDLELLRCTDGKGDVSDRLAPATA